MPTPPTDSRGRTSTSAFDYSTLFANGLTLFKTVGGFLTYCTMQGYTQSGAAQTDAVQHGTTTFSCQVDTAEVFCDVTAKTPATATAYTGTSKGYMARPNRTHGCPLDRQTVYGQGTGQISQSCRGSGRDMTGYALPESLSTEVAQNTTQTCTTQKEAPFSGVTD